MLVERMNCQCGFVDQLKKRKILTEAESEESQSYVEEQELNTFILKCLYTKKYQNLVNFLRLLEETCQTHLVNYMICFKGELNR